MVTFSSRISTSVKNNLTASMLAQEGIEVIRAIRDENWLASPARAFYAGLNEEADGSTTIGRVQYDTSDSLLSQNDSAPLYLNANSGIYSYDSGDASPTFFKRKISITKVSAVELKVISEVTWTEAVRDRSVSVEDHLFDWK